MYGKVSIANVQGTIVNLVTGFCSNELLEESSVTHQENSIRISFVSVSGLVCEL